MAILDLTHGQEKLLQSLIVRENRELLEFPESFFRPIGDVIALPDGRAAAYLLGDPQDVETHQISGKVYVKYTRLDLSRFFANITRGVFITNPTSTLQLIPRLAEQFGIVIPEEMVFDDVISGESGTAVIRLKVDTKRSFILSSNQFDLRWEKPRAIDLRDLFSTAALSGFDPEIPYLEMIENIFTVSNLSNTTDPAVTNHWSVLSEDWFIPKTEWALLDFLLDLTVGGAYAPTKIAEAVNKASRGLYGTFICDNTATKPNLWNGAVSAQKTVDVWAGLNKAKRCVEFSPDPTKVDGDGVLKLFYNQISLNDEEFVLPDAQTDLRSWLTPMVAPVTSWDVNRAPTLFNVVTGQKYGPWIASSGGATYRNLWWSGLTENLVGSWVVDGVTYNRRAKWSLSGSYARTVTGVLTFYYNAR